MRAGLLVAILAAMGSFAVVAGGISPADVFAPRQPEPPNVHAAAVVPEPEFPLESYADQAVVETRAIPSAELIREQVAAMPTVVPGTRLTETQLTVYASLAGWPAELHDELLVVAHCESKNRPYATNGVMRGLMQLHPMWFSYAGHPIEQWADPLTNLSVAYSAYQYDIGRRNVPWTQWQCKPDGTVAPPPAPPKELAVAADAPAVAAGNGETVVETAEEESTITPTATPAPWDNAPSWPPQPKSDDVELPSATPEPTVTPTPLP